MDNEIIEKFDKLYNDCQDIFTPEVETSFNPCKIKDEDKMKLFSQISNFFLQKRVDEAIRNEKY